MPLTTILIVSIIILVIGFVLAAINMARMTRKGFEAVQSISTSRDFEASFNNFGKTASSGFGRHIFAVVLCFIGGLGTLISGISLIVQHFSK